MSKIKKSVKNVKMVCFALKDNISRFLTPKYNFASTGHEYMSVFILLLYFCNHQTLALLLLRTILLLIARVKLEFRQKRIEHP